MEQESSWNHGICTPSKQADPRRLKTVKCEEFSVKRPEDKENDNVTGVLCVSNKVVVIDCENYVLKLFDQSGTYLSSTELTDSTWGITYVHDSTFATCALDHPVHLWTVRGQTIVSEDVLYRVDHYADGIHYNGTYYCVLHNRHNAITILDRQGQRVRKITKKEACGKTFKFGWDIHMDRDTNNIHVSCHDEDGVLCMTIEGQALWFIRLSRPWGITEIHGTLCVSNIYECCLHIVSKEGGYVRNLLAEEDLGGKPDYIYYGLDDKLYVNLDSKSNITVFSVSWGNP